MVLVIDNYDSFTYNLVQQLGELGCDTPVLPGVITVTNPPRGCWTGWSRPPSGQLPASGPPERRVPDAGPVCRLFR